MRRSLKCSIFMFLLLFPAGLRAEPVIDKPAPEFTGVTSDGKIVSLADFKGKPVILEWTNHWCPFVRKHYNSGNMQRTQRRLTEEGAVWVSVISSAPGKQGHVKPAEANRLSAKWASYADMILLDGEGTIGRAYGAKTTPHMFLIDETGVLRYMGAIDDRPSVQLSSVKGARNYVLEAWKSFKAGEPIEVASTKAYGCTVKY
jgi:peroxiredoxin